MNFPSLLFILGLMGMVCSESVCGPDCKSTTNYCQPDFKHVSELRHSSVAPWNFDEDKINGREPAIIQYAHCNSCNVKDMIAKPIILQVSVYRHVRVNDTSYTWCKCPFNLAVGCTCVSNK